jgi:IclR family KDG regulon transcriptional repressor
MVKQPDSHDPPSHITRTLLRGLKLLELVAEAPDGIGVTELAEGAALDKATTSRLLATLRETGWARQDPVDRRYRLTGKVAHLSRIHSDKLNLRALARPHLTRLRDEVNETAHLGVIEGDAVVYIDKLECSNSIRLISTIGQHMPILTTALGRAILAVLPEPERAEHVRQLVLAKRTARTIADRALLLQELAASAERGYAVDHEQNEEGVSCVGAAIREPDGSAIAAISVSGPTFRMVSKLDAIGRACCRSAAAISRELGSTGDETRPPQRRTSGNPRRTAARRPA